MPDIGSAFSLVTSGFLDWLAISYFLPSTKTCFILDFSSKMGLSVMTRLAILPFSTVPAMEEIPRMVAGWVVRAARAYDSESPFFIRVLMFLCMSPVFTFLYEKANLIPFFSNKDACVR